MTTTNISLRQKALAAWRAMEAARLDALEASMNREKRALQDKVGAFFGELPQHYTWRDEGRPVLEFEGLRMFAPSPLLDDLEIAVRRGENDWTSYRPVPGLAALGEWLETLASQYQYFTGSPSPGPEAQP